MMSFGKKDNNLDILRKEVDKHIEKIKETGEKAKEGFEKFIKNEIEKQLKERMVEIKKQAEEVGIDSANKMLSVIRERVEKHVVKQARKKIFKKLDVFEKDVTSLRSDKERVEQNSITDSLTQTYNRRYFDSKIIEEFNLAKRFQTKLAVLLFDIDHFKQVNDNYGHMAGDVVLKEIVELIDDVLRKNAVLFRYGGEEFAVLLPETDDKDAYFVAERIRGIIEDHEFEWEKETIKLTISVGIASYPAHSLNIEEVVKLADKALYKAKDGGRNRIEIV